MHPATSCGPAAQRTPCQGRIRPPARPKPPRQPDPAQPGGNPHGRTPAPTDAKRTSGAPLPSARAWKTTRVSAPAACSLSRLNSVQEGKRMGIQDRDYYRENFAKNQGMHYDARTARYVRASLARITFASRDVPGADWHWSLKLIVWLALAALLLAAGRYFGR